MAITRSAIKRWLKGKRSFSGVEKVLRQKGFKKIDSGTSKVAWMKDGCPFVVKVGYFENVEFAKHPKVLPHTPIFQLSIPTYADYAGVAVQPKVDTSRNVEAWEELTRCKKMRKLWCDNHDGNCGHYKGKAVVFDL